MSDEYILMVAGGGSSSAGNSLDATKRGHADANIYENGKNASVVAETMGKGGVDGFGGFHGVVSSKQISSSGGGAGYYGNGNESYVREGNLDDVESPSAAVRISIGKNFEQTPGVGGSLQYFMDSVKENNGGFGGGGSGSVDGGAGGGGGYSGGGGGAWNGWGGGGGSVNNAENPFPTTLHTGRGSVTISLTGKYIFVPKNNP